jgi:hypothetical protein
MTCLPDGLKLDFWKYLKFSLRPSLRLAHAITAQYFVFMYADRNTKFRERKYILQAFSTNENRAINRKSRLVETDLYSPIRIGQLSPINQEDRLVFRLNKIPLIVAI